MTPGAKQLVDFVAMRVLGWHHDLRLSQTHASYWRLPGGKIVADGDWNPTEDVKADYLVLEYIRDNWTEDERRSFSEAFEAILVSRKNGRTLMNSAGLYRVGDYSVAAHRARVR